MAAAALVFGAAGAGQAHAQIKHLDYTMMDPRISPQAPSSFYMDPSSISDQFNPGMQKFVSKAPNMDRFLTINHATLPNGNLTMGNSPDNGRMTNSAMWQQLYPRGDNLAQKMVPPTSPNSPQISPNSQRLSSLNDYTDYSRLDSHITGPSKFTDSYVFHPADQNTQLSQVGRELSLQDINRYQFQGSHSGEPGLPYTQAGGSSANQPTYSNSNLVNGPATFDGAALQSGIVHSGTASELNLITRDGTRPYAPLQTDTSINLSNGNTSNSNAPQQGYETVWAKSQSNNFGSADNKSAPFGGMMPAGDFTPTTQSGAQIPLHFDPPKMIIQVQKGGFVGVDDGTPKAGQ